MCHSVLRIGISGLDEVESLLWFMGLLDNTDYETLEEAENEVQGVIAERPSLWAMIANQIRSG